MIKNYLLLTVRTYFRNPTSFIINLVGMSIALGCCITAWVNYRYNVEFDSQQVNAANLYRIGFWSRTDRGLVPYGVAPIPIAGLIRENMHEGDLAIQYISKNAQFRIGDEVFQTQLIYTEPDFTRIFNFDLMYGSLALNDKSTVLISDKLATTYFGTLNVVGQPLTQLIDGVPRDLIVGGVYNRFEANSSFRFDIITSYDNYFTDPAQRSTLEQNWARWSTTFLYLQDESQARAIEQQLAQFTKTQNEARPDMMAETFYVEPFIGMSNRAIRQRNQGHWLNGPMPPAAVIAPFAMAGLLLLVACFNFMNNAIAVSGNRLKEIGIRKAIGGKRKELIIQFLSETLVFCVLAMGVGLVLAEYFTAGWNGMWSGIEIAVRYSDNAMIFVMLGALTLITALIAGGYPAFYISSFRPIEILRGKVRFAGAGLLTKSLLVFQFSISLAAVIFAIAFYFNSRFQKSYDLGYSWRTVIQVPLSNASQFEPLKNKLAVNPLIHAVGGSEQHIYQSSYKAAAKAENGTEQEINVLNIGEDYFKTMNIRVLAGRGFTRDQASDGSESVIINEEFAQAFGIMPNAVGQRVLLNDTTQLYIIGVVKDVYLRALFEPLEPLAFRYVQPEQYRYLVASTDAGQLTAVNEQVKEAWQQLYPMQLYPGKLMETNMMMALEHFDSVVILYTFLGLVAIIMSVSGLYSLISLHLQKRTKELGIRKILGASVPHMLIQTCKMFAVIMVIAFGLGSLLGIVMVDKLMDSVWEYYEAVDVTVVTAAILILFVLAVITIGHKVRSATVSNPVDALRHE